mmetsp:Transcript_25153/g.100091  ORF Transcript_25153/g.100091 Transcript_25153/m.100091 type:complete len:99 (-) Transcript_25153:542-838(-)
MSTRRGHEKHTRRQEEANSDVLSDVVVVVVVVERRCGRVVAESRGLLGKAHTFRLSEMYIFVQAPRAIRGHAGLEDRKSRVTITTTKHRERALVVVAI